MTRAKPGATRRQRTERTLVQLSRDELGTMILEQMLREGFSCDQKCQSAEDRAGCPALGVASDACTVCQRGDGQPMPAAMFAGKYPAECPGTFECNAYRFHSDACWRCRLSD